MARGGLGKLQVGNSEYCRFEYAEYWAPNGPGPRLSYLSLVVSSTLARGECEAPSPIVGCPYGRCGAKMRHSD